MNKNIKTLLVFGAITVSVICIYPIVSDFIKINAYMREFTDKVERYNAFCVQYDTTTPYNKLVIYPKMMKLLDSIENMKKNELSDFIKKYELSDSIKINHKKTCQYD